MARFSSPSPAGGSRNFYIKFCTFGAMESGWMVDYGMAKDRVGFQLRWIVGWLVRAGIPSLAYRSVVRLPGRRWLGEMMDGCCGRYKPQLIPTLSLPFPFLAKDQRIPFYLSYFLPLPSCYPSYTCRFRLRYTTLLEDLNYAVHRLSPSSLPGFIFLT